MTKRLAETGMDLAERDREICKRIARGETASNVANDYGISRSRVQQIATGLSPTRLACQRCGFVARGVAAMQRHLRAHDAEDNIPASIVVTNTGCWHADGIGTLGPDGYTMVGVMGRKVRLHRYMYERMRGSIPRGYEIDHYRMNPGWRGPSCSRACCNPEHLEALSKNDHIARSRRANRDKTHCHRGHPLSGDNLYRPRGRRCCRACRKQWKATHRAS